MRHLATTLFIFSAICATALVIVGVLHGFGITAPDPGALVLTLIFATLFTIIFGAILRSEVP